VNSDSWVRDYKAEYKAVIDDYATKFDESINPDLPFLGIIGWRL
jgi:hypothetical protein